MAKFIVTTFLLVLALDLCFGDIYMHNPRGSNNRLDEATATRANNNRMFDSQNNNRGGYNVGDKTDTAAGNNQNNQYRMKFFQSGKYLTQTAPSGQSELTIEWTNQHGCGGNEDTDPHKQNCNIVFQMMCQDDIAAVTVDDGITFRDGSDTQTQTYTKIDDNSNKGQFQNRRQADVTPERGLQEPWFSYDACNRRERNKGLFLATQNLDGKDKAINTRQNPNGGQSGYECPEERDYFPYWHPTPFVDIAVLAQNSSMCTYYTEHSFNRHPKHQCVESYGNGDRKHFSTHNNEAACTAGGGVWTAFYNMLELAPTYTTQAQCEQTRDDGLTYKWGKPWDQKKIYNSEQIVDTCFVMPPEIDCMEAGWSRSNHLGNGREGVPLNYTWVLPYFPSQNTKRCVLRARYNISTDDYDPYNTDASQNGDNSPIEQNPLVDVGANGQALRLAINTAQTGRTFQDRSHVFTLAARPSGVANTDRIHNLNVRGKRGNIVQVYPAVEYDFIPNRKTIAVNELLHIQWTGSNTHDNGGPGGDGQTGDAGQGTGGTDRHNICETLAPDQNYPLPEEVMRMFKNATVVWSSSATTLTTENLELFVATAGYYECKAGCPKSVATLGQLNSLLNNAYASFEGVMVKFTEAGEFFFICTRNNNFTNRSQKGHLVIL